MKRNVIITIISLIIIFLLCFVSKHPTCTDSRVKNVDKFIKHYVENGFLNGTVLIAEKGKIIYHNAYGIAGHEWNIPHQINGKFQIYSMSKQFTSMIMLQLAQEGLIELDDPITKYLKYYRTDTGNKIKIHHLLNHSHGIAMPDWNDIPLSLDIKLDDFIENYLSSDLVSEPGILAMAL